MNVAPAPEEASQLPSTDDSLRPIIVQTAVFTALIIGAIAVGSVFLKAPLETFANWVVAELGYAGVFFGVLATDVFTIPIPPDAYLFVVVASDGPVAPMLAVCCAGSIIAGSIAYKIGPYIQRLPFLNARLENFRPRGEKLFRQYGKWTVAIAALTPIPFSVTCWLAGIYKMSYPGFFLATFARIPRLVGYYGLFALGWAPGVA